jgi:hypothetical protein
MPRSTLDYWNQSSQVRSGGYQPNGSLSEPEIPMEKNPRKVQGRYLVHRDRSRIQRIQKDVQHRDKPPLDANRRSIGSCQNHSWFRFIHRQSKLLLRDRRSDEAQYDTGNGCALSGLHVRTKERTVRDRGQLLPARFMSDWKFLNKSRVRQGMYGSDESYGFNGMFEFVIPDELRAVRCIASDGMGWQHVSVSFGPNSKATPSWELMCKIKDLFFEEEDTVVQFHPAKSQYVNYHAGCLHLWRSLEKEQPIPHLIMVGPKAVPC